jgi:hypothetical protein
MDNKYCSKCGAELPDSATFCPKCGTPVSQAAQASQPAPAGGHYRYEKHEKQEKEEKHEKGRGGDITGAVVGGLILILLGVTFYLQQLNLISSDLWWAYFIIGLGAILILQGAMRRTRSGRPFTGSIIGGAILLLIGLAFVLERQAIIWPLILVVIGVVVILSGLAGRRRVPNP